MIATVSRFGEHNAKLHTCNCNTLANSKMHNTVDMCTEHVYCKKSMVSYKIVTIVIESTSDPSGHTGAD